RRLLGKALSGGRRAADGPLPGLVVPPAARRWSAAAGARPPLAGARAGAAPRPAPRLPRVDGRARHARGRARGSPRADRAAPARAARALARAPARPARRLLTAGGYWQSALAVEKVSFATLLPAQLVTSNAPLPWATPPRTVFLVPSKSKPSSRLFEAVHEV